MLIGISGKIGSGKDTFASMLQYLLGKVHVALTFDGWQRWNDTLLDIHVKEHQSGWEIKKFADPLKEILCIIIGCTRDQLEDRKFKETSLGEEWRVWYWSHYRLPENIVPNQRLGSLYFTKEEAEAERERWSPNFEDGEIKTHILTPRLMLQLLGTDCGRKIIHPNIWVNALMARYQPLPVDSTTKIRGWGGNRGEVSVETRYPNWLITDVRFPNEAQVVKEKNGILIRINRDFERVPNFPGQPHLSETALDDYVFDDVIDNSGSLNDLLKHAEEITQKFKLYEHNPSYKS